VYTGNKKNLTSH